MTQQCLFVPGTAGREILARTLARKSDPATSLAAARRAVQTLSEQQGNALDLLAAHGPGTTREISARYVYGFNYGDGAAEYQERIHYLLARRLPELERKGLARTTGDVRNGARVWEAVKEEA